MWVAKILKVETQRASLGTHRIEILEEKAARQDKYTEIKARAEEILFWGEKIHRVFKHIFKPKREVGEIIFYFLDVSGSLRTYWFRNMKQKQMGHKVKGKKVLRLEKEMLPLC